MNTQLLAFLAHWAASHVYGGKEPEKQAELEAILLGAIDVFARKNPPVIQQGK